MSPDVGFLEKYELGVAHREKDVRDIVRELRHILRSLGISARVEHRVKSAASTWRKMLRYGVDIDGVHDLLAARVIVNTNDECYEVLGRVLERWPERGMRFKDYICLPKANGYRSLHVTFFDGGRPHFELQIRTEQMHWESMHGTSAHWRYKTPTDPTMVAA
jgi:GTP pyrophosphokinase